jgi:RNA polymerase-binding transcription factor DksA
VTTKKKTAKNTTGNTTQSNTVAAATTAAILGIPVFNYEPQAAKKSDAKIWSSTKVKPQWSKYYKTLLELHERLMMQMDGLAKESAEEMQSYSLHMADSGTDNFDRDFALSLLSSDQDAVYEIEEALRRIEKETYGVCELTGKAIPKARLEAIPWTRFTVEAQMQMEKDGIARQRRLGTLGSVDSTGSTSVLDSSSDDDDTSDSKSNRDNKD